MRVTHRFHPWFGREFALAFHRSNWGEDRVYFNDDAGDVASLPTAWTDAAPADPFVVIAAGRCPFRLADLLVLADLVAKARRPAGT